MNNGNNTTEGLLSPVPSSIHPGHWMWCGHQGLYSVVYLVLHTSYDKHGHQGLYFVVYLVSRTSYDKHGHQGLYSIVYLVSRTSYDKLDLVHLGMYIP